MNRRDSRLPSPILHDHRDLIVTDKLAGLLTTHTKLVGRAARKAQPTEESLLNAHLRKGQLNSNKRQGGTGEREALQGWACSANRRGRESRDGGYWGGEGAVAAACFQMIVFKGPRGVIGTLELDVDLVSTVADW